MWDFEVPLSGPGRCRHRAILDQGDLQVARPADDLAVRRHPAIRDAKYQLGAHHALDLDAVDDLLHGRQHLAGELQFTEAERPAAPRGTAPAEKKTDHLPQRIQSKASRHDRVALEVTGKKPEVRTNLEDGPHQALAVLAA